MALYYPGCSTAIPDPICSDCPERELAGVRSYGFVSTDFVFTNPSNVSEWTTGITNKDIYVFPYTKGSVEVAENMVSGFGDLEEMLDSYTYTLNIEDPNYAANYPFYNAIKNSKKFKVFWRTETQIHISDVAVTIVPKNPVSDDKKANVTWQVMVKFTQDNIVEPVDMPSGVFEQCIAVS
jgi:hypothetical protein